MLWYTMGLEECEIVERGVGEMLATGEYELERAGA